MRADVAGGGRARPWRRFALFAASLVSLAILTYAGVMLAFSVPLTAEMVAANPSTEGEGRAIVVPVADPRTVRTHLLHGEGALLVSGERDGSFPVNARNTSMARALAYVAPREGAYEPPELTLVDVPSRNGTSNFTLDVAALAGGNAGWIVMGGADEEPTFYARGEVVGEVARFASASALGLSFGFALVGFVAPLVALIATHRPSGRPGAPPLVCLECGSALASTADFCLRCGAYRTK